MMLNPTCFIIATVKEPIGSVLISELSALLDPIQPFPQHEHGEQHRHERVERRERHDCDEFFARSERVVTRHISQTGHDATT
jgi:hypothetical protein